MEPGSRVRDSLQPVLPRAGEGRARRGDHVEGHGDPGHVHAEGDATRDRKPTTRFQTEIPAFADNERALAAARGEGRGRERAAAGHAARRGGRACCSASGRRSCSSLLLFWLMRRAGSVQNALGSFGRSRARRYQPSGDRVTFADVAGIEEAKAELTEVVDFLRHPDKYRRLGGRIPHGVLLSGPPGHRARRCSRARSPARRTSPFFSMAASEFVEAIVGVGASRVRDLFTQAKEAAPAIVFIDELDAIGRSRTSGVAGFSGGNDEREQTLNQILTEMDGFDSVDQRDRDRARPTGPTCSTRRCSAPGRFDRRVAVQPPDRAGREAILQVHTRGVPLAPDVDLGRIAATTPGMVGADLANLVNEAALLAARREPRAGRGGRLHRRARADRARRRAAGDDERRRTAAAPPTTRAATRSSGMLTAGRRPGAQGLDHPARPGARRHVLGARQRPLQLPRAGAPARRSRSRSAAAPPRRSCSARSAPAPSRTSSSSPRSPGRWSAAGA